MAVVNLEDKAQEVVNRLDMTMLEAPESEEEKVARELEEKGEVKEEEKVDTSVEDAAALKLEEEAKAKLEEAKKDPSSTTDEIKELRQILRDIRAENQSLKAIVTRHEKVQKGEIGAVVEPEEVEVLQNSLKEVGEARVGDFGTFIELMELNPKFEDVKEVCTKGNFDDIFENVATIRSEKNGSDFGIELLKVKNEVWHMPNPYKYMYGVIKEFHPAYAKKEEEKEVKVPEKELSAKELLEQNKREKKPVTAPSSVASMGGGDTKAGGGWTSEKIDAMSEEQLATARKAGTLTKAVYDAYMADELD